MYAYFRDATLAGGLTFFDSEQVLAIAHLKAKPLTSGSVINTSITLDFDVPGNRESKLRDTNNNKITLSIVNHLSRLPNGQRSRQPWTCRAGSRLPQTR